MYVCVYVCMCVFMYVCGKPTINDSLLRNKDTAARAFKEKIDQMGILTLNASTMHQGIIKPIPKEKEIEEDTITAIETRQTSHFIEAKKMENGSPGYRVVTLFCSIAKTKPQDSSRN